MKSLRHAPLAVLLTLLCLLSLSRADPAPPHGPPPPGRQANGARYAGWKVVRVPTGPSMDTLERVRDLVDSMGLELWTTHPRPNSHLDVMMDPRSYETFVRAAERIIRDAGLSDRISIMHEDLGRSILEESRPSRRFRRRKERDGHAIVEWFDSYHPYPEHLAFLNDLVKTYPNNSRIITIPGATVEGRVITGINIFGASGSGKKPAIIWHGNVHAREWITSMVVEYMTQQLLSNYAGSPLMREYLDNYDFYIFPIVNPDGFIYSQTVDRLWRKNRQAPPTNSTCYGRDINRNWDSHWSDVGGASSLPCAADYKGQTAADSPEVRALAAFQNEKAASPQGVKLYLDWHSYAQMFFTPYGYTCTGKPEDYDELVDLAKGFVQALQQPYGTEFEYGAVCNTIYKTTGTSNDYTYDVTRVKYSFAAELRDTGSNGFILPTTQILPSGIETWVGVQYLLSNIK